MATFETVELRPNKLCDLLIPVRRNAVSLPDSLEPWFATLQMVLLRVVRVWNQTGQKHAGEPDIANTVLPAHKILLWLLVLVTYFDVIQRLSRRAIPWASRHLATAASLALGVAALGFKVAFTKADTPELLEGLGYIALPRTEEASLVAQARALFMGIAVMVLLTSFPAVYQRIQGGEKTKSKPSSKPIHLKIRLLMEIQLSRSLSTTFSLFFYSPSREPLMYPCFFYLRRNTRRWIYCDFQAWS